MLPICCPLAPDSFRPPAAVAGHLERLKRRCGRVAHYLGVELPFGAMALT